MLAFYGGLLGAKNMQQLYNANPEAAKKLGYIAPSANPQVQAPAAPARVYTPMPAGYDPATQGEWNFYQPKASATKMKKGGKVASKPAVKKSAKPAAKKAAPKKVVSAAKPKGKK